MIVDLYIDFYYKTDHRKRALLKVLVTVILWGGLVFPALAVSKDGQSAKDMHPRSQIMLSGSFIDRKREAGEFSDHPSVEVYENLFDGLDALYAREAVATPDSAADDAVLSQLDRTEKIWRLDILKGIAIIHAELKGRTLGRASKLVTKIALLDPSGEVATAATELLGKMDHSAGQTVKQLSKLANHNDMRVRDAAITALQEIAARTGSEKTRRKAIHAIWEAARKEPSLAGRATNAMMHLSSINDDLKSMVSKEASTNTAFTANQIHLERLDTLKNCGGAIGTLAN